MILWLLLVLGIAPCLIGSFVISITDKTDRRKIGMDYVTGMLVMLAIFQLLAIPFTILKRSLTELAVVYSVVLVAIAFFSIWNLRNVYKTEKFKVEKIAPIWGIALLFVFLQMVTSVFFNPDYVYSGDDTTYITMANDTVETDQIYLTDYLTGENCSLADVSPKYTLTSYLIFTSYLAKISGLHVLIVCKTILPILVIGMAYCIWTVMAEELFKWNKEKTACFVILLSVLNIFGSFSNYTISFRLLVCSWQGKALLAVVVLPYLFFYCWQLFWKEYNRRQLIIVFLAMLAASSGTVFGNGLAPIMILLIALIAGIYRKNYRMILHAGICCMPNVLLMMIYMGYGHILTWLGV